MAKCGSCPKYPPPPLLILFKYPCLRRKRRLYWKKEISISSVIFMKKLKSAITFYYSFLEVAFIIFRLITKQYTQYVSFTLVSWFHVLASWFIHPSPYFIFHHFLLRDSSLLASWFIPSFIAVHSFMFRVSFLFVSCSHNYNMHLVSILFSCFAGMLVG